MTKKWVFETIVENDTDIVGLVAYALYKSSKHTLASKLRTDGRSEEDIKREITTFHDHTIANGTLQQYRIQAGNYLNNVYQEIEKVEREEASKKIHTLKKSHKDEIERLKKTHANNVRTQKNTILKNMRDYQSANKGLVEKLYTWLLSGIPSLVSTFFISCLLLGASMLLVSETKRKEVLSDLAAKYFALPTAKQANSKP